MITSSHWLQELSPSASLDVFRDLAWSHAEEAGIHAGPIKELLRKGKFRDLVEYSIDYSDPLLTPYAVKHARQAVAYFQKLENLDVGIDREAVSLEKFMEAERLCGSTNDLFDKVRSNEVHLAPRVSAVIHSAQRKIARILGDCPQIADLSFKFGPGATRGVKKAQANALSKLRESPQCSEALIPLVRELLECLPHVSQRHSVAETYEWSTHDDEYYLIEEGDIVPVEVVHAKVTFQPKSAKALRVACTEAGLNVLFQLAIGEYMATRLKKHGIDIKDQSVNQLRAYQGSLIDGIEATIDLSSASDTISTAIVSELLPFDWYDFLSYGRSHTAILPDGSVIEQEKFSSMGNGFTFPLETLIFWSLAASCCRSDSEATAYGDDLVVPQYAVPLLYEVLHVCGFVVNKEKSFTDGPFRESCGRDCFLGTDVRPCYQKEWVSARSLFTLHNHYVRDGDLERAERVRQLIPQSLWIFGPDAYGDGHLLGDHPRKVKPSYRSRGYCGYLFDTYVCQPKKQSSKLFADDALLPLYLASRLSSPSPVMVEERKVSPMFWLERATHWTDVPIEHRKLLLNDLVVENSPLPSTKEDVAQGLTALTVPGVDGYKKVSVYTLC